MRESYQRKRIRYPKVMQLITLLSKRNNIGELSTIAIHFMANNTKSDTPIDTCILMSFTEHVNPKCNYSDIHIQQCLI